MKRIKMTVVLILVVCFTLSMSINAFAWADKNHSWMTENSINVGLKQFKTDAYMLERFTEMNKLKKSFLSNVTLPNQDVRAGKLPMQQLYWNPEIQSADYTDEANARNSFIEFAEAARANVANASESKKGNADYNADMALCYKNLAIACAYLQDLSDFTNVTNQSTNDEDLLYIADYENYVFDSKTEFNMFITSVTPSDITALKKDDWYGALDSIILSAWKNSYKNGMAFYDAIQDENASSFSSALIAVRAGVTTTKDAQKCTTLFMWKFWDNVRKLLDGKTKTSNGSAG